MNTVRSLVPTKHIDLARRVHSMASSVCRAPLNIAHRMVQTPALLLSRRGHKNRRLEIGPGTGRIEGFETLNIVGGRNVDYVWNAERRLPFRAGTFSIIYASHILEHVPWFRTERVLKEWVRVLASGGRLELWVPDGLKICKAFIDAESSDSQSFHQDGWYRFNERKDPCAWASGRIFSYGDGSGYRNHPNWHLAIFSPRYLEEALKRAGCSRVERLERSQVRGHDHGWINLGVCGIK